MSEADIISALNLGSSRESLRSNPTSPLGELLTTQVNEIVDRLRNKIHEYGASASDNLSSSLLPSDVQINGSELYIEITAPFYWKFVNYGVNGSLISRGAPNWGAQPNGGLSMSTALAQWERSRGITYSEDGVSSWVSKSHVEGMGLKERGQIARPFFTDVVNNALVAELEKPIMELMKKAIKITIVEPWR